MLNIKKDAENTQFYVELNNKKAFMDFELTDDTLIIRHTEVPISFEGKGVGSGLVKESVNFAEKNNLKIKPLCSFAQSYLNQKEEFQHLLV